MKIDEILAAHFVWLRGEGGKMADLSRANLSGADLVGANLRRANLNGADLSRANLASAKLVDAEARGAKLTNANLFGADLTGAGLSGAKLTNANLFGADLTGAGLSGANFLNANLANADLYRANLIGAVGVIHPPVNDPRGFRCIAVWHGDHWMIAAGCHWFTVPEAGYHWGEAYAGNREIADAYLRAVEWVAGQPAPQEPQA